MESLKERLEKNRKPNFWEKNLAKVFSYLGLFLLLLGLGIASYDYYFVRKSIKTIGEVIRLDGGGGKLGYAPVIEYFDENQESHLFFSAVFSRPPAYAVGEKVSVYYQSENPKEASLGYSWLAILVLAGIGIVFSFFGILFQKFLFK
ncbi:DUF3592 domain-containing protein [Lacihabitans sp. LS3-19]|uniref:DUF3592 domain-containing protein n=1 Tax=Lacihabitans sp. LS3-19 TaxID=2487335 RepID=UPI0020CEB0B0|nr:DUF3592 domain-containing protein [Lacihabitans sp. LS3-19]MCP9768093.1 DUF3592 domain-containing protein [Lacihabitans sp. LS3-19]